ncbi:uncharacterized protein [Palaemon carinicauda]|uniref:uncharacterized protein n=1 Tax=Palaemon carinicauda TaxID=392227 RepID=UPI0035B5A16B
MISLGSMANPSLKYAWRLQPLFPLVLLFIWSGIGIKTSSPEAWIAGGLVHECVKPIPDVSLTTARLLFCAMQAKRFGAVVFFYQSNSGTCGIYNVNKNTTSHASVYTRVPPASALEDSASWKFTNGTDYYIPFDPPSAVDGDEGTFFSAVAGINSPYWLVDMGEVRNVHFVKMLPTWNGDWEFLELRLGMEFETPGNFTSYTLFATFLGPYSGTVDYVYCYSLGVLGRYLSIQKMPPGTDYLSFTEVKVYTSLP